MRYMRLVALHVMILAWGTIAVHGQGDSLWKAWNNTSLPDSSRLQAIQTLAWKAVFEQPDSGMKLADAQLAFALKVKDGRARYEAYTTMAVGSSMKSDYKASLEYLEQCLAVAQELNDPKRVANAYRNMSNVHKNTGDLPQALAMCQKALVINEQLGNKTGLADTYNTIGNLYTEQDEWGKALENYEHSRALYEELDDPKGKAQATQNIGATHLEMGERTKAVEEFLQSLDLYRTLGRRLETGMAYNNLGRAYSQMARPLEAHTSLDSARAIFTQLGSKRQLARTHYYTGELLRSEGHMREAIAACQEGSLIAQASDLLQQQKECSECLMLAFEASGDLANAFRAQKTFISISDSLENMNNNKEVMRLELQHAFQQQQIADSLVQARVQFAKDLAYQKELSKGKEQRNWIMFSAVGVLLLAGGLFGRLRYIRRSRALVQKERDRSDELLHNILPKEVATELKAKGSAAARSFEQATVLFTDFKGFTQLAEQLGPADLVAEIDHCFKGLDAIVEHHRIEKIKTIGDAYMAAAGLPDPNASSAKDMVFAALEMQEFIQRRRTDRLSAGLPAFEMRAGIHTGPVIAGIVGVKKFAYDIWGDTVNTASRMESSGEIGRVNISATTYAQVKNVAGFRFEARGLVGAKNKGDLEMYFVSRA
ncbi:MAG: adenylate/guanylate cyclase domain-containing protein [Flavobacteriales bacterium]